MYQERNKLDLIWCFSIRQTHVIEQSAFRYLVTVIAHRTSFLPCVLIQVFACTRIGNSYMCLTLDMCVWSWHLVCTNGYVGRSMTRPQRMICNLCFTCYKLCEMAKVGKVSCTHNNFTSFIYQPCRKFTQNFPILKLIIQNLQRWIWLFGYADLIKKIGKFLKGFHVPFTDPGSFLKLLSKSWRDQCWVIKPFVKYVECRFIWRLIRAKKQSFNCTLSFTGGVLV